MAKRDNAAYTAFLWGASGALILLLETLITQIFNKPFLFMLQALPFYETFSQLVLLCAAYFLCAYIAGFLFTAPLNYICARFGEYSSEKKPLLISLSLFWAAAIFIYGRWWITDRCSGYLVLAMPALLLCSVIGGALSGVLIAKYAGDAAMRGKRIFKFMLFVVCVLVFEIAVPKIYFKFSEPNDKKDGARVILITVDTVKADHLSCYGYERSATPNFDKIAAEGVLFRQAVSPCPLTNPTHSSLLTGLYPQTHGVRNISALDPAFRTIQSVFKRNGYATAAFVSGFILKDYICGLDKDFDLYQDRFSFALDGFKLMRLFERAGALPISNLDRKAGYTNRLVIPWLRRHKNKKFFLWLHYYDPHLPYEPPPRFVGHKAGLYRIIPKKQDSIRGSKGADLTKETIEAMTALYDGEIAYTDECVGEIMQVLEETGLKDETLLILTSDHGEGFDHDYYFDHGDRLYDSAIHVPLIFRYPRGDFSVGSDVYRQVELTDIPPTVLSILGFESDMEMEGRDISPLLYGSVQGPKAVAYSESPDRGNPASLGSFRSVRTDEWKYIYNLDTSGEELYNIKKDPLELTNVVSEEKEAALELKKMLFKWMKDERAAGPAQQPAIDKLTEEKLRSLGYVQ